MSTPLISCIMPTAGRHALARRAVAAFLTQRHVDAELIIVADEPLALGFDLAPLDRVRMLGNSDSLSIGPKRNVACEHARGELIAHWDDDDWYPPWRLAVQAEAMRDATVQVCGTSTLYYAEPRASRGWRYTHINVLRRPFLAGNTLMYRAEAWRMRPFPRLRHSEDAYFLRGFSEGQLYDLARPDLCVGTIHSDNTSRKRTKPPEWKPVEVGQIEAVTGESMATLAECLP